MDRPLILDRYRPLADLGAGGHGSVTLAFDTKMARRVAIKRLPLPTDRSGRPLARTGLAEARTAALLNHPAIVTVHEWDTDSDEAFIVMEDIDGASLADLLDSTGGPLDLDEAAAVIEAVADAVAFAHANGVLHLDLKPANVLVTRDGRVKVADFGVSALTDTSGRARGIAGTVGYMPPEQIRGQSLDERTDGWALASLAYELLTNANPFDADTAEGSLFRVEIAPVPAPSEFEPSLPPGVDLVLTSALAADPADRYPSVPAFADALLDHLGDPAAGRESLAELVDSLVADEDGEADLAYPALGVWDRLARRSGLLRRAGAAAICGWLAWMGVAAFTPQTAASAVAAALTALAAALAPGLGLALGLLAFCAGAWVAVGWVAGLALGLPSIALWVAWGRRGGGESLAPLASPALGLVRCSLGLPMLLGFVFEPVPAAAAAALSAALVMLASAASGHAAPFLQVAPRFLTAPWDIMRTSGAALGGLLGIGPLAAVLAWALAAALCSLACRRATRTGAVVGALIGSATLVAGYSLWAALPGASIGLTTFAPDITAGLLLVIVVIILGPPTRPEEPPD